MKTGKRVSQSNKIETAKVLRLAAQVAAIVIATCLIYLPALRGDFVWDDDLLIRKNPLLQNWAGLREIWGFGRTADYFPLTNTIFWIEWHLFGTATAGYHVVNIVLQIANALLLWATLNRLQIRGSWLAGLIFAVHPVHVESVAWISELKNVLSMFWALISVLLFLCFIDRKSSLITYFLSLVAFVLALLAKTQVVFLPVALFLVLWWRDSSREKVTGWRLTNLRTNRQSAISPFLAMLLPYFAVAIGLGLVSVFFQNRGIGQEIVVLGGIGRRLANAGIAVWWYAGRLFAPVRLMPIYPAWRFGTPSFTEWLPLLGILVLLVLLWLFRDKGASGAFVAVTCFVAALLPILGFLQMSYARSGTLVADHYQYFADVFLIALASAGIAWLWHKWSRAGKSFVSVVLIILLGGMTIYGRSRAEVYQNEETLWRENLAKNPDAWQAHNRLGQYYFDRERFADAVSHFERAAVLKPELADNYNQLGLVYCRLGRFEEGIAEYKRAIQIKEGNPATARDRSVATMRTNLANALTITANNLSASTSAIPPEAMARYDEAITQYQEALSLEPMQPAIHRNLGILLARLGRNSEAIQHLRTVLQLVPNEPNARELLQLLEHQPSQ